MGNRRHHKKLRIEVRARMARTGESYQQALGRIRGERPAPASLGAVDLLPVTYFGARAVVATFEIMGRLACLILPTAHRPLPYPANALVALTTGTRIVH